MRKLLLLICLFVSVFISAQTVVVFRSYEEYKTNQGQKSGTFLKMVHTATGKYRLVVKKGGKKVKIKCEKIWGFMLEKELFRTYGTGQYVMMVGKPKLFYFENGEAYLNKGTFIVGHYNFVAKAIDSELVPVPNPDSNEEVKLRFENFKKENPQHKKFYECFDKKQELENCRECMDRYNDPDRIRPFQ